MYLNWFTWVRIFFSILWIGRLHLTYVPTYFDWENVHSELTRDVKSNNIDNYYLTNITSYPNTQFFIKFKPQKSIILNRLIENGLRGKTKKTLFVECKWNSVEI